MAKPVIIGNTTQIPQQIKFSESGLRTIKWEWWTGLKKTPGVYLLVLNDEVVYVGQGVDVWKRSRNSKNYKCPDADIYLILLNSKKELDRAESALMALFEPRLNGFITDDGRGKVVQHFLNRSGRSIRKRLSQQTLFEATP